ncbi:unnamed protein product [Chrysoparadoxa australica]
MKLLLLSVFLAISTVSQAFTFCAPLVAHAPTTQSSGSGSRSLTMKRKGKPNVPIQNRGGYNNMQKMQQAMDSQRQGQEGKPVFEIFCRTEKANIWYPCGSLAGDDRSKATVEAYMSGFMRGVHKSTLEKGVASSVLQNERSLKEQIGRGYPQLRKSVRELQFGFKIKYPGLEEKVGKQEITVITQDMATGIFDKAKAAFDGFNPMKMMGQEE